uniref:FBA_2 domain-containing protein n=1 Tax=Caenorhabditis tropicalis TaxID=1561998 RepID=A0A1I7TSG2_9PELO
MDPESIRKIFSYLFHQRSDNSVVPIVKNEFDFIEILDISSKSEFIINRNISWKFEDHLNGSLISVSNEDGSCREDYIVVQSKIESFRKVVQFYLNLPETKIEDLIILNHPYGLEGCVPLRIRNLRWKLEINSSRYDYTTWFNCLRTHPIERVEIELNGEDYMVLSEDVICSATKLHLKTKSLLPIQAILKFQASELKLNQSLSSDDLFLLFDTWIQRETTGKIILKCSNADLNSIENQLKEEFKNTNFKVSDLETNEFSIEISE